MVTASATKRNTSESTSNSPSQFEAFTRLARLYEKAGITSEERMIPYHMSDSYNRLMDLLNNDREGFISYVARPYITEVVMKEMRSNPNIIDVMDHNENLKNMDEKGKELLIQDVIEEVVKQKWQEPLEFLKDKIGHKYRLAGFYERRLMSGGGLADAHLTLGSQRDEKKQYYASWYGKGQIIRISHEQAPSIYFTGEPGAGKTNGAHNLVEEMIANQYWVYTNMPIVSDYGNVFITRHYSDLYIDTPEMPSILRALLWAREHRIPAGSYLVYDEGGRGAASKSVTLEGETLRSHLQIRRHFASGFLQTGVQRMNPRQEAEGLLDILIEAKKIDTGKTNSKTRDPIYRFYWDIATRGPNRTTQHEFVYNIPLTSLRLNYASELRLPYPLDMDMNLENFEKEVDFVSLPLEKLIVKTREYVRMMHRDELIGAPIYGEGLDREEIEKTKEKEMLRTKMEEPVKKEDMVLSQDQIEAIGELRKAGNRMIDIAKEFNIPLAVLTKICRQYNWL